jgi:hypothetical protein
MASIARNDNILLDAHDSFSMKGFSRPRVVYVLETVLQVWNTGAGLLNAWQAGMVAAHNIQCGKLRPEFSCGGTELDESHGHVCSWCYHVWHCHDFIQPSGAPGNERICPRCIGKAFEAKPTADDALRQISGKLQQSVYGIASASGRTTIIKEAEWTNQLTSKSKPFIENMITSVCNNIAFEIRQFPSLKDLTLTTDQFVTHFGKHIGVHGWKDTYAPSIMRTASAKSLPGKNPFQPSADAVFPYTIMNGRTALHTVGNMGITAMYINLMKQQWLPGTLGLVSETQTIRHLDRRDQMWIDLLCRFDHQFYLIKQIPNHRSSRLDKGMHTQQYEAQKLRWISGKSSKNTTDICVHGYGQTFDWRPDGHARIEVIITQMEKYFSRNVLRSSHGAPWFFIEEHLPDDWNWKWLWQVFDERRTCLGMWCNKKWVTVDDIERLILECIFQWLQTGGRDVFLGLEMTIFRRHPLCFVLAKKHHEQQMRTGWKRDQPTDLFQDYDESLSNISFETQLSNYCKSDFDEDYYVDIIADLKNIPLESEFYIRLPSPVPRITIRCLSRNAFYTDDRIQEDANAESDNSDDEDLISDAEDAEE